MTTTLTLAPGSRLGPYEIVAPIGAGGMGEVYRARDTRLGRDVAIKVLPASFAADADRLRRFEQEARAAGVLNHPNLLAVFDIGTHQDVPYVVSELLEGETLRARIDGNPLPLRKALDYAAQIARGLAAAHDKGIVHRDLKPDNVFVTRDGRVKILDFGLAKVSQPGAAAEKTSLATLAGPATSVGVVMGTAGYMSPEQVRAQPVDHRSDIFSFGAVLYEMVTGTRAFSGESAVETMNAILTADPPPLTDRNRKLPPAIEEIVGHCLEKSPEERFQSARDIAFHLESLGQQSSSHATTALPATSRSRRWAWVAAGLALVICASAAFVAGRATVRHVEPRFLPLTFQRGSVQSARFAPDGRTVVYSASWDASAPRLYTAQPGNPESRPIGIEGQLAGVSGSGEMALLVGRPGRGTTLVRMPLGGGAPREVLERVEAADWGPDGDSFLVLRNEAGRFRLEFPIGTVLYTAASGWLSHPRMSPAGSHIAFGEHPILLDNRGAVAVVDRKGEKRTLSSGWEDIGRVAWSPDGTEVWFSAANSGTDHSLFAVTLDGRLRTLLTAPGNLGLHDVAADGRVVITQGGRRPAIVARAPGAAEERDLSWMDFSWLCDLSEDGRQVLFSEQGVAGGPGYAVYMRGTDGSPAVRLGRGDAHSLSHDGRWVVAADLGTHTLQLLPTGAGQPRSLPSHGIASYMWVGFTPDDRSVIFLGSSPDQGMRTYIQDLEGGRPRPVTPAGVGSRRNTLSPDGQWIAANVDGRLRLYPVDGSAPREIPGAEPVDGPIRWSADGRTLFVRNGTRPTRIVALDVRTGARAPLHELTPQDPIGASNIIEIRLTPDGQSYAYSLMRSLNGLYQVDGLR